MAMVKMGKIINDNKPVTRTPVNAMATKVVAPRTAVSRSSAPIMASNGTPSHTQKTSGIASQKPSSGMAKKMPKSTPSSMKASRNKMIDSMKMRKP